MVYLNDERVVSTISDRIQAELRASFTVQGASYVAGRAEFLVTEVQWIFAYFCFFFSQV